MHLMGTNEEPWFNRESIFYVYNKIKEKNLKTILEYGGGASTYWFLKMLNLKVTTIEDNIEWIKLLKNKIEKTNFYKNWNIEAVSPDEIIDYNIKWDEHPKYWKTYVSKIFNYDKFDVIVIDGKSRNECIKTCIDRLTPNGILIIDNAEREIYKSAIDNYIPKNWKRTDFINFIDTTTIWEKMS